MTPDADTLAILTLLIFMAFCACVTVLAMLLFDITARDILARLTDLLGDFLR